MRADKRRRGPSLEDFARELGLKLRRARLDRGLSQEQVAHAAGISAFTYQKFEKGESRPGTPMNPRMTTLLVLSEVLGVPICDLLAGPYPQLASRR